MESQQIEKFVESWGSMGMLWGINRSMARIHGLLIATSEPLALDTIAERLLISRGNTSMSLRELRNWGVIRRIHLPGDRKDYYVTESDVWSMLFRIVSERKKREFDPALGAVRGALAGAREGADPAVTERLQQMEELMSTMNTVMCQLLADESTSRTMLRFVSGQLPRT